MLSLRLTDPNHVNIKLPSAIRTRIRPHAPIPRRGRLFTVSTTLSRRSHSIANEIYVPF